MIFNLNSLQTFLRISFNCLHNFAPVFLFNCPQLLPSTLPSTASPYENSEKPWKFEFLHHGVHME